MCVKNTTKTTAHTCHLSCVLYVGDTTDCESARARAQESARETARWRERGRQTARACKERESGKEVTERQRERIERARETERKGESESEREGERNNDREKERAREERKNRECKRENGGVCVCQTYHTHGVDTQHALARSPTWPALTTHDAQAACLSSSSSNSRTHIPSSHSRSVPPSPPPPTGPSLTPAGGQASASLPSGLALQLCSWSVLGMLQQASTLLPGCIPSDSLEAVKPVLPDCASRILSCRSRRESI